MRVLIVDDSVVFRSQIKAAIEQAAGDRIEVAGTANNGRIAIQKLAQGSVDVVTLDIEMPEMGGIETIREIRRQKYPVKIIVFSSLTQRGSEAALEALTQGADDLVAKPCGAEISFSNAAETIARELLPKLRQFRRDRSAGDSGGAATAATPAVAAAMSSAAAGRRYARRELDTFRPSVVVIGSSTGGPTALEGALRDLPKSPRIPIVIAQHMPPVFTASLAKRLEQHTGVTAAEGKHGEPLQPGRIFVAPGNYHLTLVRGAAGDVRLRLDQNPPRNSVRPAVDPLFETAAALYGPKTLGVILTGMGEDGLLGCRAVKELGGGVLIQDRASSTVFGMPGAVFGQDLQDGMGDPAYISRLLRRMCA